MLNPCPIVTTWSCFRRGELVVGWAAAAPGLQQSMEGPKGYAVRIETETVGVSTTSDRWSCSFPVQKP